MSASECINMYVVCVCVLSSTRILVATYESVWTKCESESLGDSVQTVQEDVFILEAWKQELVSINIFMDKFSEDLKGISSPRRTTLNVIVHPNNIPEYRF